ncbi:MAG: metalloregulator ArsR/SmtB family transcription factor [Erysipelotrichaceae bacterium]|nr:metalloregulator ArsR/SmtB family transcription factor [Erysipelotrichaceae bacterium]MDD3809735.1 metalloregulator ArsR/SmtB family transcription factor [Erysipelotrichaceae bacterium]
MISQAKEVAGILKVLANENRLLIVCYLIQQSMNVTQLHVKLSHLSQPAISQHLATLKAHGIVDSEKQGNTIFYKIKDERVETLIKTLKANYCDIDLI